MRLTNDGYDVIVVGAGPVGQVLAVLLAQMGRSVLVVERQPAPYGRPRAVVLDLEATRILAAAGVLDRVDEFSEPSPEYDWQNAAGQTLLHFPFGSDPGTGWPVNRCFNQPGLEAVLLDRIAALPGIDLRFGVALAGFEQDADGVTAVLADGDTVRGRFLVGCDGANSMVRELLDVPVDDRGFFYDWAVIDVLPREARVWKPMNLQVCDPARPTTAVSGGPGRRRFEFMLLPGESAADFEDPAVVWALLASWKLSAENAVLERSAVYRFRARCAQEWRSGRVALAGDAAHQMPPFFGQGLCSGLRDTMNLAWKLDVILRGKATPDLLNTYTVERSAHVQHAIGMSVELGRVICLTDPDAVAERDRGMLAAGGRPDLALPPVPPPQLGAALGFRDAEGGLRRPGNTLTEQARLRDATGRVAIHDEIAGAGFVIASVVDPRIVLSADQRAGLAGIGARLVWIHPRGSALTTPPESTAPEDAVLVVEDVDDYYVPHLGEVGAVAVVVRPDFYLFGVARTPEELPVITGQLLTQLAGG